MKSFLVSWLARKYAGADLRAYLKERPEDWLVWEAGPWRPPAARSQTIAAAPGAQLLTAGESLAIALVANDGGADVRVGRAPENDITIDDATLSRQHLVVRREPDGRWTLRDAGSSNGTKLNAFRLGPEPAVLEPGARIEAGAVRLTFYDGGALYLRLRGVA